MAFTINTNINALGTYQNLTKVQDSLSNSLAKLSSGLRINNAGDDAAGLTIATQLGSQVSGLQQASRNAQDGVSVVQTADGALTQTQSLLGRLRDLAVQAANDSNSPDARTAIAKEATSITDELGRLSSSVNFNGQKLLDGSTNNMKFQVGANGDSSSQITVDLSQGDLSGIANAFKNGSNSTGTTYTGTDLTKIPATLDFTATNGSTTTKVSVGSLTVPTSFQGLVDQLNGNASFSAKFTATVTKDTNGAPTGFAVSANDNSTVTLDSAEKTTIGATETPAAAVTGGLKFDNATNAQLAIKAIDTQLSKVSSARATIGALENRFASAVSTINTSITNLTAAKSRITDVDMASEMVNYSRANILSQSGTAMLAQANSQSQLVLKLLG